MDTKSYMKRMRFGVIAGLAGMALSLALPTLTQAQVTTTIGTNGVPVTTTNTATPPANFNKIGAALKLIGQTLSESTNWAAAAGYGRDVSGGDRNVAFAQLAYNFNDYVGLVLGYDYMFGAPGHQFNSVKGGMTLQLPMHPFAFIGSTFLTNLVCTPLVFDEIATSSSSSVANIVGAGVDFDLYNFGNLAIHAGVDYENRTGDAVWSGDYALFHFALTRNF
jgi:hypothetical protein